MCARGRPPQRLMRTLLVVVAAETIEAPPLLGRSRSGRLRRLDLQCTVHALVTAIVRRAGQRDVARLDTELEPPNRQRREPGRRAELRSVVGAYRIWQANLIKDPFHRAPHASPRRVDNPYIPPHP
jgi:hypothetical protein